MSQRFKFGNFKNFKKKLVGSYRIGKRKCLQVVRQLLQGFKCFDRFKKYQRRYHDNSIEPYNFSNKKKAQTRRQDVKTDQRDGRRTEVGRGGKNKKKNTETKSAAFR